MCQWRVYIKVVTTQMFQAAQKNQFSSFGLEQLRNLFCDRNPDCSDGSDENICSVTEDPNRFLCCKILAFRNLKPELHLATREHVGCQNAFVHPTEQGAFEKKNILYTLINQVARWQHAAGRNPNDGHFLLQRSGHGGADRERLQQAVQPEEGKPQRLHCASHLLCVSQVHRLCGGAAASQARPRDRSFFSHP